MRHRAVAIAVVAVAIAAGLASGQVTTPTQYRANGPFVASCNPDHWWFNVDYYGRPYSTNVTANAFGWNATVNVLRDNFLKDKMNLTDPGLSFFNPTAYATALAGDASKITPVAINATFAVDTPMTLTSTTGFRTPMIPVPGNSFAVTAWLQLTSMNSYSSYLGFAPAFLPFFKVSGNAKSPFGKGGLYVSVSANGFCINLLPVDGIVNSTYYGPGNCTSLKSIAAIQATPSNTSTCTYPCTINPAYKCTSLCSMNGQWFHLAFAASKGDATDVYSLYLNGIKIITGNLATTFSELYGGGVQVALHGQVGSYPTSNLAYGGLQSVNIADLQIYTSTPYDTQTPGTILNLLAGGATCTTSETIGFKGVDHRWVNMTNVPLVQGSPRFAYNDPRFADADPQYAAVGGGFYPSGMGVGVSLTAGSYIDVGPHEWGTNGNGAGFTMEARVYRTLSTRTNDMYGVLSLTLAPSMGYQPGGTFDVYMASTCITTPPPGGTVISEPVAGIGSVIIIKHPVCGVVCYSSGSINTTSANIFAQGSGVHTIAVMAGEQTTPLKVYVDGMRYVNEWYEDSRCTSSQLLWPTTLVTNSTRIGNFMQGFTDEPYVPFTLLDFAMTTSKFAPIDTADVFPAIVSPPPPPAWTSGMNSAERTRYSACGGVRHRYGSTVSYPFVNGEATDGVGKLSGQPWPGIMTYAQAPKGAWANGKIVFPAVTVSGFISGLDFGPRVLGGSGFTIAFMHNAGPAISANTNAPGSGPMFDIGGYSMYYNVVAGPVYLTSPDGNLVTYQAPGGTQTPAIPQAASVYTVVTYHATHGAKVYYNGNMWASFPTVLWNKNPDASGTFYANSIRVWGPPGSTLLDLQFYESTLSAMDVRKMSVGLPCHVGAA